MTKKIKCSYAQLSVVAPKGNRLNLKYFNYSLLTVIVAFGVFYLFNINDLTVKGFALKDLNTQAASLASQQVDSEQKANALESYYYLSAEVQKLNMVAVGNIEYLAANQGTVAKR